jgi:4-amino-4-deoxy-L-arabinose transferase-like glycosyltransferase
LRLFFIFYFPAVTDDSRIYANLATNWLQHGVFGQTPGGPQGAQSPQITPTDARLPGYPAFLAVVFWLFGVGNFKAVMLSQALFDLGTCFIVADVARRLITSVAARLAFALTALCPFLANYSSAVLTETLEIFFTALALDCAAAALNHMFAKRAEEVPASGVFGSCFLGLWAATGAAIGVCILLRPDGGILLGAVALYLAVLAAKSLRSTDSGGRKGLFRIASALVIVTIFALAPLVPWTIRNFRTLHHFQPLAPRYATDSDELVLRGFNLWVKTWMAEYASVEEVYWNVPGDKIDPQKLPARAIENQAERDTTSSLLEDYNESQDITPELDARFGQLAAERISTHPLRYYVVLPLARVADMWLRPRTEMLPPDVRWWEFNDDVNRSAVAVGFGVLNLAYLAAALLALIGRHSAIRWSELLVAFLLLRSAFLGTMENPEPRYTLECYPAVIVLASALLVWGFSSMHRRWHFLCLSSLGPFIVHASELRISLRKKQVRFPRVRLDQSRLLQIWQRIGRFSQQRQQSSAEKVRAVVIRT